MGSTRRSSDRTSHADVVPGLRAEGSSVDELISEPSRGGFRPPRRAARMTRQAVEIDAQSSLQIVSSDHSPDVTNACEWSVAVTGRLISS